MTKKWFLYSHIKLVVMRPSGVTAMPHSILRISIWFFCLLFEPHIHAHKRKVCLFYVPLLCLPLDNEQHELQSWSLMSIPDRRKIHGNKGNLRTKSNSLLNLYFRLELDVLHLLSLLLPSHYVFLPSTGSLENLKPYPSFIPTPSMWVCPPLPPCSFLLPGGP